MALTKVKAGNILLTTPGASSNDVTPATTPYVTTALANLADSAPSTLDTLNELAAALGDDANFSTTVTNSIAAKAPLASPSFTGNVGIGITPTEGKLHIKSDGSGEVELLTLENSTDTNGKTTLTFKTTSTDATKSAQIFAERVNASGHTDLAFRTYNGSTTERMRIDSAGNVGIGTTSPTFTATSFKGIEVEVSGDLFPNVRLERVSGSSKTNQAYEMVIGSLGNWHVRNATTASAPLSIATDDSIHMTGHLGVGTPGYGTYHSDTVVLGLGTGSTIRAANSGADPYVTMANNAYHDASSWKYIHADFASSYEQYNGTHVWNTAASGSAGAAVPFAPRMRINSSGEVGIGVTPLAHYTGYRALDIGTAMSLFSNSGSTNVATMTNNGYLNSGASQWTYKVTDEATMYSQVHGDHRFSTAASGSAGGAITWSESMRISSSGNVSFNGGVVKGARQTINHQGTTNAVTVSGNTYTTTITSVNVTTTGNSKLMIWAHSGQILKSFDNANPLMNIHVAGTRIGSAHGGNHYWYATAGANSTAARVFLTQFGLSGTLAAGTHTVSLIAGSYGADHTFNYQNQNCHMVIMEVGA